MCERYARYSENNISIFMVFFWLQIKNEIDIEIVRTM